MTWLGIAGLFIVAVLAAHFYILHSIKSIRGASRAWDDVADRAESILSRDYPAEIKDLAYAMLMKAGCGCFAIMMLRMKVTAVAPVRRDSDPKVSATLAAMKALTPAQRKRVDELFIAVIAYDALARPLISLFFGSIMGKPTAKENVEPAPAKSVGIAQATRTEWQVRHDISGARAVAVRVFEQKVPKFVGRELACVN